jgi:phenylglyoxylate dehydrogenase epsilon subunit
MSQSKYLIVGSSHAGLSALEAIRAHDQEGGITLLTQDKHFPYSPTILPYVVSNRVKDEDIFLMGEDELSGHTVTFKEGAKLVSVDTASKKVSLESGETLEYENLLLATGAEPALPPIDGLQEAPFYVLRTLEDALRLRRAAQKAKSAIVLGAGLIGMHAAENLLEAGLQVTVVEALSQVLPGYFDETSAAMIQNVFFSRGVKILTGNRVVHVTESNNTCTISTESGEDISADLLVVATGVRPRIRYLPKSGVKSDEGILVDSTMRTSANHVWAAGDVAQSQSFFDSSKRVHATLPTAVEQGRTAGMDMVGDPALKPDPGGIPMNTYKFFGNRSFSIGLGNIPQSTDDMEVDQVFLPSSLQYQKLVFHKDRLVGVSGINSMLEPGIMYQLVKRRLDLSDVKKRFASNPLEMGRVMMSQMWS